ncbi:thioredoxin family protein [Dendrosporobacter sp. 1207_IL3150]|uniref:thioredoxin family protein n=1 Tax=Dendrosporobacter sp. 1207_IL3150 TaxID=3084054 RepID=UPI003FA608AA
MLGSGCAKCTILYENVQRAIQELGLQAEVLIITEMTTIMQYGVMVTPAIVIDGVVKSAGKILSISEVEILLQSMNL